MNASRAPLLVQGLAKDHLDEKYPWLLSTYQAGMRSWLAVPLISTDEVIGALVIESKANSAYTEQDTALAVRIGTQIAGAVANAQLYASLQEAESGLRVASDDLELRVVERTAELSRVNQNLEEEMIPTYSIIQKYVELDD